MKNFLLISDIHACEDDPSSSSAASYVSAVVNTAAVVEPFAELIRLVEEESLAVDFILCPGDITNRATKAPLLYAWQKLAHLANLLNAKLIATVGNHDVDSRYINNAYDASEFAKSLNPTIPTSDRATFLEFWAEHFTLVSTDDCNILALNTAAYHGSGKDVQSEKEYGRISALTLKGIRELLARAPKRATNILLCHHHVTRSDSADTSASWATRGGDQLIDLLNDRPEAWIIVHGHRHVPDLLYGHGGSNSPTIIGCASFSAQINFDSQNKNPNQVHFLTCDPAAAAAAGWASAGQIRSWTWQPGIGWRRSHGSHGLGYTVGFGYRSSASFLAARVDEYLTIRAIDHISWQEACTDLPSLLQLIPSDFRALERALSERRIAILAERDGRYAQIGRLA